MMIPNLTSVAGAPWRILPPGMHAATLEEVEGTFATNPRRRKLFAGLVEASGLLRYAGCRAIYLDGSFVSGKPLPGDFDVCWDHEGVDPSRLDPVFLDFNNRRAAQKARFMGEFFPLSFRDSAGTTFLDFFQVDKATGGQKGILAIALPGDPVLNRTVQ